MDLAKLERWVEQLRKIGESHMPYVEVDGQMLSPEDLLREARKNSPLWQKARAVLGNPHLKSVPYEVLMKRIEQRAKEGRLLPVATIGGRVLTPQQQLEEIKKGTRIGQQLLLAEAAFIEELEKRRAKL